MTKTQYIFSIIKEIYRRSLLPTKGDKRFIRVFACCVVLYALVAFAFLFTGNILVAWLMYATMSLIGVVEIVALFWRFRDIARHLKEGEQTIQREEIAHTKLRKRALWPLGFIILTFIPGVLLPYTELKIVLLALANL